MRRYLESCMVVRRSEATRNPARRAARTAEGRRHGRGSSLRPERHGTLALDPPCARAGRLGLHRAGAELFARHELAGRAGAGHRWAGDRRGDAHRLGVPQVGVDRGDDDAGFDGDQVDADERDAYPGVDDDAFVEDAVEDVDEARAAGCSFNWHLVGPPLLTTGHTHATSAADHPAGRGWWAESPAGSALAARAGAP